MRIKKPYEGPNKSLHFIAQAAKFLAKCGEKSLGAAIKCAMPTVVAGIAPMPLSIPAFLVPPNSASVSSVPSVVNPLFSVALLLRP